MTRKKKKNVEIIWNGKKVNVIFKKLSWEVFPLEGQFISQAERFEIIKAVVNYV